MVPPTNEQLAAELARLKRRLAELERATGLYATSRDLDSPSGDPLVKFGPRDWRGADHTGRHFSACEPDFLDQLAEMLQWSAENPKPGKEKFAAFNRKDAARARSWARRIRARSQAPGGTASTPASAETSRHETRERGTTRQVQERPTVARGRADRHAAPDQDTDFLDLKGKP